MELNKEIPEPIKKQIIKNCSICGKEINFIKAAETEPVIMNLKKKSLISPLSWMGGKDKQWSLIKEELPEKIECWIEPFLGGGSVALHAIDEDSAWSYILNDLNEDLIGFFSAIKKNGPRHYQTHPSLKKIPRTLKEAEILYDNSPEEIRFWIDNILKFNGMPRARWYQSRLEGNYRQSRIERLINASWLLNKKEVALVNSDYVEFVKFYLDIIDLYHLDSSKSPIFFFLDPPYFYSQKNNIYNNHSKIDFTQLKKVIDDIDKSGCKFLLTIDASVEMEELFKDYKIIKKNWKYTSTNRRRDACKTGVELFVKNY
ncbi:Modification methylase DpnIIA [Mesoplasma sp. JKS002660]|uniref:DNA adenine methylase n=1 Tax=Mesoplasma whartonense TaxID=2878854 RepID=UPI0020229E74|nr:DNA adenine methylase [Mesoplasma sp. JKS002660]MCL8213750.1 Modification methylase DpnIIA [Mesoplasma sp. JKS002660]